MTRKLLIYGAAGICVLIVLAGIGVAAMFAMRAGEDAEWLATGDRQMEAGAYNLAKAAYVNYLGRNRTDIGVLRKYADASSLIAENRRKNLADAATAYHQIERNLEPGTAEHAEIVEKLTDLYIKIEAWGDLTFFAEQQLRLDPENKSLQMALARSYAEQSRFDEAEDTLQLFIAQGADDPDAYRILAEILYDRRLENQAVAILDQALTDMPDHSGAHVARAKYFWRNRNQEKAFTELDAALALDPNDADALFLQAYYRVTLNEFEKAAEFAERCMEVDPDRPELYSVLAHAYRRTNRTREAIELLEGLDPLIRADYAPILLAEAEMLFSEGDIEAGKEVVAEYQADFPTHRIVREYFRGRIALLENNPEEAIKVLQMVYRDQPAFTPAHYFLVVAQLQAGHREAAREILDIYLRAHPEDHMARAIMAQEFGRHQDIQTLIEVARGKLASPSASAEELVNAAGPLIDSTISRGLSSDVEDLVRELLAAAVDRGPSEPVGYRAMVDFEVAMGDFDRAQETYALAVSQGIDAQALGLSEANLKLKLGDREAVLGLIDTNIPDAAAFFERGREWVDYFAARNEPELALHVISHRDETVETAYWDLRTAELKAQLDDFDEALALLARHGDGTGTSETASQLDRTRISIAREMIMTGDSSRIDEAEALVDVVLAKNPSSTDALLIKSDLVTQGAEPNLEKADAILAGVLESEPANVPALLARASLLARRGDYSKALELAEQATTIEPGLTAGLRMVGELHITLNETEEARSFLEKAVERFPADAQLSGLLVQTYLRLGLGREAERALAHLESLGATDAEAGDLAAAMRSEFFEQRGQAADAEALLREQFAESPDSPEVAAALAENLLRQGKKDEAFAHMEAWASAHGTQAEGWIALARLYLIQGTHVEFGQASTALTRALVADPQNLSALREMTELQMQMGNYANAATFADRFLSIRPDDADIIFKKATLLARERSRLREALSFVDKAIALRARDEYRLLRGYIYLALEEYREAMDEFKTVAQSYTTTPAEIDLAIAECYVGIRDLDMGRRFYDLAVKKAGEGESLDRGRLMRVEDKLSG